MTEKEKSFAGLLYQPGDPALVAEREKTTATLYAYNQLNPLDREGRDRLLRELLGHVGANAVVEQPLFCTYGTNTTVGDNVFIAPNVCIITEEHSMVVEERIRGLEYTHPVTIGNNVWICTGALVLPGVTIGDNSVIGAGSVVTKDIPPNSLAVGNPCRVIRSL